MAISDTEIEQLISYLRVAQNREFDPEDIMVISDALGDLPGSMVLEATRLLVQESTDYITPAHIRARVKRLADARLSARSEPSTVPPNLSTEEYLLYRRAWREQVILGQPEDVADRSALSAIGMAAPIERTVRPVLPERSGRNVFEQIDRRDDRAMFPVESAEERAIEADVIEDSGR